MDFMILIFQEMLALFVSIDDGGLDSETKLARLLDSGASDNFVVPTGF